MKILIVGAGAVGKVYGRHLNWGGADVTFFIKEKYVDDAKSGYSFYELNDRSKRHTPQLWTKYRFVTRLEQVAAEKWDYVIFAMSSTALQGGWVDEFIPGIQSATVLTLQPGLYDREFLLKRIPEARLIDGTIHIISYEAPLPTENLAPGTAYWTPPGSKAAFSGGTDASRKALLGVFQKGHFAVEEVEDARKLNVEASPILNLILIALERADWEFSKLKQSPWLPKVCAAMPEGIRIQARKSGVKAPNLGWILKPWFVKALIQVCKLIMPFDIEAYLKVHFIKVEDQRHQYVKDLIDYGNKHLLNTRALEALK